MSCDAVAVQSYGALLPVKRLLLFVLIPSLGYEYVTVIYLRRLNWSEQKIKKHDEQTNIIIPIADSSPRTVTYTYKPSVIISLSIGKNRLLLFESSPKINHIFFK